MTTALADKLDAAKTRQAVAKPKTDLLSLLRDERLGKEVADALPAAITKERFMRAVLTEVRIHPKLLECTRDSFLGAMMLSAQLGLEPGPLGLIYYVPFRNSKRNVTEVTPIIGYKGLITLARRSGEIQMIKARTVRAKDEFTYSEGLNDELIHKPNLTAPDRGPAIFYYAVARFANGGGAFRVMTPAEVEKIHKKSKSANDGPWVDFYEEMAQKTCVRQLANRGELPLTIEAAEAIATDEAREFGLLPTPIDLEPETPDDPEKDKPTEEEKPETEPAATEAFAAQAELIR